MLVFLLIKLTGLLNLSITFSSKVFKAQFVVFLGFDPGWTEHEVDVLVVGVDEGPVLDHAAQFVLGDVGALGDHVVHLGDESVERVHGVEVEADLDVVVLVGGDHEFGVVLVAHEVDADHVDDVAHGTLADVVRAVRRLELSLDLLAGVE